MMRGTISPYGHPLIEVELGTTRAPTELLAVVDSGFDGELCLPMETAVPLGLQLSRIETV